MNVTRGRRPHTRSSTFSTNAAVSGGGLALTLVELGGALNDTHFLGNTGVPGARPGLVGSSGSGLKAALSDAGCGREDSGGGGGLCVYLRRSVAVNGGSYVGNIAVT